MHAMRPRACPCSFYSVRSKNSVWRAGAVFRVGAREVLLQVADGAAPLRVLFATSVDAPTQEQTVVKLLEAGYHMDLAEPLERVAAALQSLVMKGS